MAEDAWSTAPPAESEQQTVAPADNEGWGSPRGRQQRSSPPPRRASRSRSPRRTNEGRNEQGDGSVNPGNNLHVANLSPHIDSKHLEELFGAYGKIRKAAIMHDPYTRLSRGFGFVTMENPEDADAAVAALNAKDFMGCNLRIEKARRARARTPTPGQYQGPPKRDQYERPYDPRPYDSRYDRGQRGYEDRGGRHEDRRYDDRRYEDRSRHEGRRDEDRGRDEGRRRYDDRGRFDDRPPRYDDRDRYGSRQDDRGYDRRDYGYNDRRY